jgi:tRNA threonylcarbamoyladenosine biosynthesis protein TsaB
MPESSKILLIDTATEYVFLSLVVDGTEVGSAYRKDIQNHAVTVMPLLDGILKEAGIRLNQLTEVIVGVGPGSYTGVRIGVAIAKMIGYLNGIPVRTVSTLALLASGSEDGNILSLIDARRGNAFMACFRKENGQLTEVVHDTLANIDTFTRQTGSDFRRRTEGKPDVNVLLQSQLTTEVPNIHELVPNYLQVTEAERNKGQK